MATVEIGGVALSVSDVVAMLQKDLADPIATAILEGRYGDSVKVWWTNAS